MSFPKKKLVLLSSGREVNAYDAGYRHGIRYAEQKFQALLAEQRETIAEHIYNTFSKAYYNEMSWVQLTKSRNKTHKLAVEHFREIAKELLSVLLEAVKK